jgi:hypothetical protein
MKKPRQPKHAAVFSLEQSHLATENTQRLYKGLERFVNTGDTLEDFRSLSKAWSSFWPLDNMGAGDGWTDDCHRLFLVYRDTLRRVWISDPEALRSGSLMFLFGLAHPGTLLSAPQGWQLKEAEQSCAAYGSSSNVVYPHWKDGSFTITQRNDFQRALYSLFRESWRAKVCSKCSSYFIAEKPARLYCSVECSNSSHKKAALKWWKEKGAKRRHLAQERKQKSR